MTDIKCQKCGGTDMMEHCTNSKCFWFRCSKCLAITDVKKGKASA